MCVMFSHVCHRFYNVVMEFCAKGVLQVSGTSLCLSNGSQVVIYLTHLCDCPLNSKVNGFLTSLIQMHNQFIKYLVLLCLAVQKRT